MSVAATIERYSALPSGSVRQWTPGNLHQVEAAILFVMATWSGQSIAAFKKLTTHLVRAERRPKLLVCDIDDLSPDARSSLDNPRGIGETFWILRGRVIATMANYAKGDWSDAIDANNRLLSL